jgi:hypothetical protein
VISAVAILPFAASAVLLTAPGAAAAGTTIAGVLGAAGPGNSVGGFAVLGLGGASTAGINCTNTTVNGNVAVGGPGTFTNASACTEKGNLYIASTVTVSGAGHVTGSTIINNALLSQAVSNAQSASTTFAGMAATNTSVTLMKSGSYTFTATQSGINVVDLSSVSGSPTLAFSCGSFPGCQWVVNDAGGFSFGNGNVTLGSGMTSGDVLFNVYSHGASVSFNAQATGNGIFLAPYSSWQMKGTWNGELIGGLNGTLTLAAMVINSAPPVTVVPVSNLQGQVIVALLVGSGLVAAQWISRRRRTRVSQAHLPAA